MEGEQLPKATMNSFVKNKTQMPFNPEYLTKVLLVAKGHPFFIQNLWSDSLTKPTSCVKATPKKLSALSISKPP